jgi:GNAT superfamily N-acetyltransferase
MRVRRAVASDSPAAAAVVRAVYDEYGFTWDEGGYHADLLDVESAYAAFFVAEREGRIVGTAALTGRGSLERLYVLADARGSGAGSALLAAVVDEARRRGHVRLEIWTDKVLLDAHRLYERAGARRAGERVNDDPDASREWLYVLDV